MIDATFNSWALGAGGIGTATCVVGETALTGALSVAGRYTSSGGALPFTGLARVVHPFSWLLDGFATVSYGMDPFAAKSGFFSAGGGIAIGKVELGYRGFFGSEYTAHLFGVTYRQELEGSYAIQRPPPDEPKEQPKPQTGALPATTSPSVVSASAASKVDG